MKTLIVLILFIFSISSCEKALLKNGVVENPNELFEFLWEDIHNRYSYFEEKQIDWKAIKTAYENQISPDISELDFFELLADLLFELEDGHVNLTSDFNRSRNWEWFQDFPINYNQKIIDKHYLGKDFWITGALRHEVIDSVLYVNYRSFMDEIKSSDIDVILNRAEGLKGIIIDVRSNGGGSLGNALSLAGAFTQSTRKYGETRIKTESCSDCFSPWNEQTISPRSNGTYNGNVAVLTNRSSYSSSTYFAQMMRVIPNVTLIGDQTGGGGGTPAYGELPNGWLYRFSSTQFIDLEGKHLEFGVPVDIEMEMSSADENNGKDSIIEFAVEYLKGL